jgi:hypothetical protein
MVSQVRTSFQSNHLGRELLKSLDVALCIPSLNNQVLPLRVAELPETLEQRVIKFLIPVRDKPDPPNFTLCMCHERPSRYPAAKKGNEIAPSHGFDPPEETPVDV